MTVELHRSVFVADSTNLLAAARSNWLDAFGNLEIAVIRCARRNGAKPHPKGTAFKQRLTELASLKPSPTLSKKNLANLQTLIQECLIFLPLRATIVHSSMQVGQKMGIDVALFQNAVDAADDTPCYVVLNEVDLTRGQNALNRLTQRFDTL